MKISKLRKLAWVTIALALGTTTLFAQGSRYNNNRNLSKENACLNQISKLSEEQKNQILKLENNHQEIMAQFRNDRRSAAEIDEKNEIRGAMLKQIDVHQEEVKSLLTESQQKEYDLLHYQANTHRNNTREWQQAKGNNRGFKGNCKGGGKGFQQKNREQKFQGCPQNNQQRKGNGYGRNSSRS